MAKVRFGICGLGCMGQGHFGRLRNHPHAEVVAVCDTNEARRQGFWTDALGNIDLIKTEGGRVPLDGIHPYATPAELIADPDVDAVLITLPTPQHAPVAVAALEAGKHVLCEKPMALCTSECDQMIRAARASRRLLMVAQCIRFWPQYVKIKQLLGAGRIGTVRFAVLRRVASAPTYSAGGWLLDAAQSGGAILDLHVHDVDFAQYLLGVPETIHARGTRGPTGGIDHVVATYGFADGRYAVIEGGWAFAAPWPFDMSIAVHGEHGTLEWTMTRGHAVLHYTGTGVESIRCDGDALRAEQEYFIDCVRAERPVERCSPASTRTSIALAWLERRAVETGRLVHVSQKLRAAWST